MFYVSVGSWLKEQREKTGITKTEIADRMHWPHGAITQIEKGVRTPKPSTVRKYIEALEGKSVEYGDMYRMFGVKPLPDEVGVDDIRRWLKSLGKDTVVQEVDGLRSRSCVVTMYARHYLNIEGATSNEYTIHNAWVSDNPLEIKIEPKLGWIMVTVFDAANSRLTAAEALELLTEERLTMKKPLW